MQFALSPMFRRLVLGGAFMAATLVAVLLDGPDIPAAIAAEPIVLAAVDPRVAADDAQAAAVAAQEAAEQAREVARDAREKAREAAAAAREAARESRRAAPETVVPGITIERDGATGTRKVIKIGVSPNEEFDSFDQFIDKAPAVAAGVMLMFLIAFVTPVMIIFLVIWYKMRKNRMINETILKLAEKGVMPSAEVMQARGGRPGPALNAMYAGMPLTEQAKVLRKTTAWTDLRRGVLLAAFGFALCVYSLINHGSANWFGLVLLFVGIGYAVLWYFEDQQVMAARVSGIPPAAPPTDPVN